MSQRRFFFFGAASASCPSKFWGGPTGIGAAKVEDTDDDDNDEDADDDDDEADGDE